MIESCPSHIAQDSYQTPEQKPILHWKDSPKSPAAYYFHPSAEWNHGPGDIGARHAPKREKGLLPVALTSSGEPILILIINGCLLDFKASIKPKITTDHLRQLVGYWLLDYDNELCIESVGVVLMRNGKLCHFKIQELLQTNIPSNVLRLKFGRGLKRDKAKRQLEIDGWLAGLREGKNRQR